MKNIRVFYLKIFSFLGVKFSIYLNRRVFVMLLKAISLGTNAVLIMRVQCTCIGGMYNLDLQRLYC